MERTQARAYIGHIANLSRACVNQLFRGQQLQSHTLLSADIQRYFRDINVAAPALRAILAQQRRRGLRGGLLARARSPTPRSSDLGGSEVR